MAILPPVSAEDIRRAIASIARDGVPPGRGSTKFCLAIAGRHYPPKYVVALAARNVLGRELRPDEFSGGAQTNRRLAGLGFTVVACGCGSRRDAAATTMRLPDLSAAQLAPPVRAGTKTRTPSTAQRTATIVRVVSNGETPEDPRAVENLLLEAFGTSWPSGLRAKFVLTPGGFVRGRWPAGWRGQSGWESREADILPLLLAAERQLANVVTKGVFQAAEGKADVLTVGIDLREESTDDHIELVAVIDLATRKVARWTGKSFPTPQQERTLVHVTDLDSHLLEVAGERVLVLGCHDLNMFSPRGHANQSPQGNRRARCDAMKARVARFRPTIALQHPHSTDTPNIWRMSWSSLAESVPSVRAWASGIAFFRRGGVRSSLEKVLAQTRSSDADVVDIIVDPGYYE